MEEVSLKYLEVQITDSCNLNCKGCSHCAGIVKGQQHVPLEVFEKDLVRLKELIPDIEKIRILGGEPFLNPRLTEYVRFARSVYKESDIRITTNGTLILSKDKEFFEELKACRIGLDISVYPPTHKALDRIEELLDSHGIAYKCTQKIEKFAKRINLAGDSDMEEAFDSCNSNMCNFLRKGVLSPCPAPVILEWLADYFGFEADTEPGKLNLHDLSLNGRDVVRFLNSPNPVCRYCTEMEFFDWQQNASPKLEDWVVRKG